MIHADFPKTAQRAAQHCDSLLARSATPVDMTAEFARFARQLAFQAQPLLARLCDARGLQVTVEDTSRLDLPRFAAATQDLSASAFFALSHDRRGVAVSIPATDLVAQFDRILGGSGDVPDECAAMPASVDQFARQVEDQILAALRKAGDRADFARARRGASFAEVAPFGDEAQLWVCTLAIGLPGSRPWTIRLATCDASFAELVGSRAASPATGRSIGERGLEGTAIGDMELPLRAVLVDMPLSIARLAQLAPGTVIPVAVNRQVPLLVDETPIAHGAVGEVDERVALEITSTSFGRNPTQ